MTLNLDSLDRFFLLQEFDIEIKNRKGFENSIADHLSRIFPENANDLIGIFDHFPNEQLFAMSRAYLPWFAHIVSYLVTGEILRHWSNQDKDRFFSQLRHYYWEDPYLFKHCLDQVIRRCIPESEIHSIMTFCHSYACGGHFGGRRTTAKVLQSGFHWPTVGLLCFVMLTISVLLVSVVNIQVLCPVMI